MHVTVDAARHDAQAGGVDLARRAFDALGNGDDAAAADADVGAEGVARGGYRAAADRKVVISHCRSQ